MRKLWLFAKYVVILKSKEKSQKTWSGPFKGVARLAGWVTKTRFERE